MKDSNLQAKRELFNALVFSELVEDPNISFVAHENLHFTSPKDNIHPNMKGSSVIARNLGRHIHNLFWERPRKIARRDLLQPYKLHPQQCRDSFILIVQELCESRGGRPGLSVLTSLLVSVDVKIY